MKKILKRLINLLSAMALFTLSFATIQPSIVYGLSFDYAVGGHSVSIVWGSNNYATWYENTGDNLPPPRASILLEEETFMSINRMPVLLT